MDKPAVTDLPLAPIIRTRWSPRVFADRPVPKEVLATVLEAARWAPSCFNDQPWRFIVGVKEGTAWRRLLDTLVPFNQEWAGTAPVLIASVALPQFRHNGAANRHAAHDVGAAWAQMALQAVASGLYAHAMAGFDPAKLRTAFALPENAEPMAAIALGWPGDLAGLPEAQVTRERTPRQRLPLAEIAFGDSWGEPLPL